MQKSSEMFTATMMCVGTFGMVIGNVGLMVAGIIGFLVGGFYLAFWGE